MTPAMVVEAVPVVERPAIRSVGAAAYSPRATAGGVQAAGWIEPEPFAIHAVALADGTVAEVLVQEGDRVTAGQVLARMVEADARLALERAEAEARAAEETWEANIEWPRAAAPAAAAAREAAAAVELARAELAGERALLVEAERQQRRRGELHGSGSISREDLDSAEAQAAARTARVEAAIQRIAELEARRDRAEAEAAAAARRMELRTAERLHLEHARVALAEARLRLERMAIVAPADGVVLARLVEPGSVVVASPDDPMMARVATLYDPARLQVRVDVPLADVARLGVGQRAEVTVEMLPGRTFTGTVSRLAHRADVQKNTLSVYVSLEAPDGGLRPDMLARVRFQPPAAAPTTTAAAGTMAVFAPPRGIVAGAAWVVTAFDGTHGTAMRRPVEPTGAEADGWAEITAGLLPGDLVIVSPPATLADGMRVRVQRAGGVQHEAH
jgi:RND family efflux transporter MFP subunit